MDNLPDKCWKKIGVYGDKSCELLEKYSHCRNCPNYSSAGRSLLDRDIPEGLINRWTEDIAELKQKSESDIISVLIFRLGAELFAFETADFRETIDLKPVHSVPYRSNDIFLGLANVSGELIMNCSLEALLEIKGDQDESNQIAEDQIVFERMLVIADDEERYVFVVDEVIGVYPLSRLEIGNPPSIISKAKGSATSGIFDFKNRRVALLNAKKIFELLDERLIW